MVYSGLWDVRNATLPTNRPAALRRHAGALILFHPGDGAADAARHKFHRRRNFLPGIGKAGADIPRHNGADGDSKGTHLIGRRECKIIDGRFRDGIIRLERNGRRSGDGAEIYDPPIPLLPASPQHSVGHGGHAPEIDIQLAAGLWQGP